MRWGRMRGQEGGFRMIQAYYIYCALYFCYYHISSTSDHQALLTIPEAGDSCINRLPPHGLDQTRPCSALFTHQGLRLLSNASVVFNTVDLVTFWERGCRLGTFSTIFTRQSSPWRLWHRLLDLSSACGYPTSLITSLQAGLPHSPRHCSTHSANCSKHSAQS